MSKKTLKYRLIVNIDATGATVTFGVIPNRRFTELEAGFLKTALERELIRIGTVTDVKTPATVQ